VALLCLPFHSLQLFMPDICYANMIILVGCLTWRKIRININYPSQTCDWVPQQIEGEDPPRTSLGHPCPVEGRRWCGQICQFDRCSGMGFLHCICALAENSAVTCLKSCFSWLTMLEVRGTQTLPLFLSDLLPSVLLFKFSESKHNFRQLYLQTHMVKGC
jgi:hypothetical protein